MSRITARDIALAFVVAVLQVGGTLASAAHLHRSIGPGGLALLVAGPAALVLRRRYPATVLAVTLGSALWYWSGPWPRGPIFFGQIVAFITVVVEGRRREAVAALVIGYVTFQWVPELGGHPGPTAVAAIGLGAWLAVLLVGGELLRARRQRAAAEALIREEEARRVASEERLRIARELHDVLAHNISLINVQAGSALHLIDRQPERAREALATIKAVSKDALVELRAVLGVLRQVDEDAPRSPAPSLARIDDLVARTSDTGLTVRVERSPQLELPSAVDQAAYRIVQEALTNVARHAGAATATVRLNQGQGDLVVEVDDDGRGGAVSANGGNGIAGMRERARALGGNLQAGPRPDGGFRVRAWFPVTVGVTDA